MLISIIAEVVWFLVSSQIFHCFGTLYVRLLIYYVPDFFWKYKQVLLLLGESSAPNPSGTYMHHIL
jgi:hypothetical protein